MKPRITDMHPDLQIKFAAHAARMAEAGIPFALTCVLRNQLEQDALYAQGRETYEEICRLRKLAGLWAIGPEEAKKVITWTKLSAHRPDQNGKSNAYDIVILKGGIYTWDIKVDVDQDGAPDYLEAAEIGRKCGLDCGAFWKEKQDYPHYQRILA